MSNDLIRLRQFILKYFNLDELRTLCFDLAVDFEELGPGGKSFKVQELILLMGRQGKMDRLLLTLSETRPHAFANAGFSKDHNVIAAIQKESLQFERGDFKQRHFFPKWGLAVAVPLAAIFLIFVLLKIQGFRSSTISQSPNDTEINPATYQGEQPLSSLEPTPSSTLSLKIKPVSYFDQHEISAIAHDPIHGDIWVAASGERLPGISRYSAKNDRWESLDPGNGGPQEDVTSILVRGEIGEREVWFGTRGEGIFILKDATSDFLTEDNAFWEKLPTSDGLLDLIVKTINEDLEGNIWIGTNTGLCKSAPESQRWQCFHPEDGWIDNIADGLGVYEYAVYDIEIDGSGNVWVATNEGLLCWKSNELEPVKFNEENGLSDEGRFPPGFVFTLSLDQYGRPWVGTSRGAVSFLETGVDSLSSEGKVTWHTYTQSQIIPNTTERVFIFSLLVLPGYNIVLAGTDEEGLRILTQDTDTWSEEEKLLYFGIKVLLLEEEERVWIGTERGLFLGEISLSQ